ncbi:hypothetical protein B0H13DRAFT_1895773 [Mycena leptocephala]|nr:hypothetical protein B0H13DRAFT_1895773 [Mycena leptocephala]
MSRTCDPQALENQRAPTSGLKMTVARAVPAKGRASNLKSMSKIIIREWTLFELAETVHRRDGGYSMITLEQGQSANIMMWDLCSRVAGGVSKLQETKMVGRLTETYAVMCERSIETQAPLSGFDGPLACDEGGAKVDAEDSRLASPLHIQANGVEYNIECTLHNIIEAGSKSETAQVNGYRGEPTIRRNIIENRALAVQSRVRDPNSG